jgi:hypothetical protein
LLLPLLLLLLLFMRLTRDGCLGPRYVEEMEDAAEEEHDAVDSVMDDVESGEAGGELLQQIYSICDLSV